MLALAAGFEVIRVFVGCAQALGEKVEAFGGNGVAHGRAFEIAKLFDRVVDGFHAGGRPEAERGCERQGRIEDDGAGREVGVGEAFLHIVFAVSDPGVGRELGCGKRCGDCDGADAGGDLAGVFAVLAAPHAVGRKLAGFVEIGPETELDQLGCIDHRAAAQGDEEIGFCFSRSKGAGDDIGSRRVGGDGAEGSDAQRAEIGGEFRGSVGGE